MKRTFRFCTAFCFFFIYAVGSYGWGPDIPIWTDGVVRCFDADYAQDGTLFVAFQPQGSTVILFYESRSRGYSWKELFRYDCYHSISKIKILIHDDTRNLFVFYRPMNGPNIEGKLACFYFRWEDARTWITPPAMVLNVVSERSVIENSFDACSNGETIYAAWEEEIDASTRRLVISKCTLPTVHRWTVCLDQAVAWTAEVGTRVSLDASPPSTVAAGVADYDPSEGYRVCMLMSRNGGASWDPPVRSPNRTVLRYDPRIALSHIPAFLFAWMPYNTDRGGHEIDIRMVTRANSETPIDIRISEINGMDEYIADIGSLRAATDGKVNLLSIEDTEGTYRRLVWRESTSSEGLAWHGRTEVNDTDITSWPEDVAPKLVYSPGVWTPGGGAVFSHLYQEGLFFDAPWNVTSGVLMIVTPQVFVADLAPLVDWKNRTGVRTYVVETDTLTPDVDSAAAIKKSILWHYQNRGVRYVMLFGDSELLPTRYTLMGYEEDHPFGSEYLSKASWCWDWCGGGAFDERMLAFLPNFFATDLYYADLYDGNGGPADWDNDGDGYFGEVYRDPINPENLDLIPDVAVGRVPVSNLQEAANYIHKVMTYERTAFQQDWFNRAFAIANQDWTTWITQTQKTADLMTNAGFDVTHWEHPAGANADALVNGSTADGLGFLLYNGHGPGGMGLEADWKVCDEKLPVVFHGGCDGGQFAPNNLPHAGYRAADGVQYCPYNNDACAGGTPFPRLCDGMPPVPDPLQPQDVDGFHVEFLLCRHPDRGAILFYGCNTGSQSPGEDHGTWFFEAFTLGIRLSGDMWRYAVNTYCREHDVGSIVPQTYSDAFLPSTVTIWDWQPTTLFHQVQKYTFFGDPTLRVGGLPTEGLPPVTLARFESEIRPEGSLFIDSYPNPFNAETELLFNLKEKSRVELTVYNIEGRMVALLLRSVVEPGRHHLRWRPDGPGSGVYLCVLRTGNHSATKRIVYLK